MMNKETGRKQRRLRPIWQLLFDAVKALGILAMLYIFTVAVILIGG